MRRPLQYLAASLAFASLAGCAAHNPEVWEPPKLMRASPVKDRLAVLPPPGQRIAVAVYGFTDQTGQFKPSDTVQTLSRAVTQGATSVLVKTLQDTGNKNWFQVIERERLDNVLRERAVIREMRATYLGEKQLNRNALPPLLFAGVLLEGGIIGYDSNTKTGGAGARFLGIGASTQYREDTVTIYLRAVSVKTGEVLSSVSVRKSIAAVSIGANAFRFVDFKELLELETGVAYNEPDQIALTQAIEKAVYALIMEGALNNLWCFQSGNIEQQQTLINEYIAERDNIDLKNVRAPVGRDGRSLNTACATGSGVANISSPQLTPMAAAPTPMTAVPITTAPMMVSQPRPQSVQAPKPAHNVVPVAPNKMTANGPVPATTASVPAPPMKKAESTSASPSPLVAASAQPVVQPIVQKPIAPQSAISLPKAQKATAPLAPTESFMTSPAITPKITATPIATVEPADANNNGASRAKLDEPPLASFITAMLIRKDMQSDVSPQQEKEAVITQ